MANKLEMRLVLYKGNTRTGYLPEAKDLEVVMPFGGIPTIRFNLPGLYNIDGVNSGYVNYSRQLIDKADVALEVNWNNTGWVEPRNARFEITEEDREDDLYGDVSLSGQGVASDLSYGMSNATWGRDKKTGGWKYTTTSVGAIVASHLRSAQNLGYCSYIVWERPIPGGWNSTLDSIGQDWSAAAPTISREASPMDVIRSLSDSVIFFMEGNQLRLVDRPRTMIDGMSKGVKCDLIYGRDLQRIPIKRSVADRVQRVVAYGENGVSSTATNWTTAGTRGPRVRAMSEGGVKDRNELRRRAQSALAAASQVNEEARRLMDLANAVWLPWRDFELGDMVHSEGWTQDRQAYPVVELVLRNMTIDSGPQVEVTLGQVNRSALRRIISSIHAVSPNGFSGGSGSAAGGSIGGSGGTVTISDPKADEGPPAAPEGFTVTSVLNTSITGDAVVDLEALWAPPTYTAAGEERWRPIQAYRVQHQDLSELHPRWVNWPETTDVGQIYPGLKPGRAYAVRMQCRTEEGWSDPTATIEIWGGDDEIPPPPPGRLTAVSDKGMVIVTWDKQFSGNQPMAVDFSHLIVFQGVDIDKMATFAGATLRPGGSVIFQATPGQTLHIGGKSVDRSGNVSEMGELVTVTVRSVLDDTDLKDRLEALDSDLLDLDSGVASSNKRVTISASPPPETGEGYPVGALWLQVNEEGVQVAQWRAKAGVDFPSWERTTVGEGVIAADAVTATAIKVDAIRAQHLLAGSVVAGKLGADAVTANNIAAGSITTEKMKVGSIDVDRISAGSFSGYQINGAIITGGTVRTAASGARVEINSAGIKTWNADGNNTAHISGTVGSLIGFSLTGGVITGPTIRTSAGSTRMQMNSTGNQMGLVMFKDNNTAFHLAEHGGRYELRFNSVGSTRERVRMDESGVKFWTSTGYSAGGIASGSNAYPSVDFYGGAGEFLTFENTNVSLSSGLSSTNSSITLDSRAAVVIRTNTALHDAWRFYTGTISGVSRTNFQFSAGRNNMPQTTLASNLHMDGGGTFYHTTSRGIFKLDQRLADYGDLALKLRPKTWVDAAAVSIDPEYNDRTAGLVLEDVLAAGGAHFASFNSDGVPDGLMYDRIHLAYIPVLQRHNDEIAYLRGRIEALEARA